MELAEYGQMEKQEQHYWWHIGRRRVLQKVLASHLPIGGQLEILDIGCGTGVNYWWLKKWGRVAGVDPSPEALAFCREQHAYDELLQIDGTELGITSEYDLAVAFDVLEHIENDKVALRSWWQALKPGGYLMITVPAHQWLWSAHDKALHHFRRYSVGELRAKFRETGFAVQFISPFFFFTFPLVVLVRFLTKGAKPKTSYVATSSWVDKILISFSRLEANYLAKGRGFPWGSSVVVVARKNV
ncbi:MAG: methyltransferase type 11 [candidate division Kazan bacterium GW2011_GWA1_50_15]|uniref:Methyltransferase type 11 n=2 Tax=Bacteria division Kazan-3B-28 TaxID=1798534 RepID=A0A0G1X621_UNCK3|nr:MAG: methyltransferase type 11 [candidate division Kazan bacterium GW2011_GWA1_50_15]KKW25938.1 MAG: Methyltransferase type 11 [candidate division Kazan bacterium GW2011_GWC1_52_13]KKW26593.1 MAG: Methyltransferase type 11 [candidate division Kazan bacterium GW2011_GWB1_52_7]HAV65691.1 hypothetical protein [Patescibacteria group bacterium]HCR42639.1 hypothetical protein [Patescibacteria group bacterium]